MQFKKKNHGLRKRDPWQAHPSQRSTKDLQSLTSLANIKLKNIAKKVQIFLTTYDLKCVAYNRDVVLFKKWSFWVC